MIHERDEMQWNQNLCLPSTSMAGSTSGSGNSWTAGISQGTTSPKRQTPDLKSSTSGIRIRSKKWTWISSPESVMCWTAHQPTLLNIHLADALWLYAAALFYSKIFCSQRRLSVRVINANLEDNPFSSLSLFQT